MTVKSALVVFVLVLTASNHARGQDDARGSDYDWKTRRSGIAFQLIEKPRFYICPGTATPIWTSIDSNSAETYIIGDMFLFGAIEGAYNEPTTQDPFVSTRRLTDALWNDSRQWSGEIGCFQGLEVNKPIEMPSDLVGLTGLHVGMKMKDALRIVRRNKVMEFPFAPDNRGIPIRYDIVIQKRLLTLSGTPDGRLGRIRILKTKVVYPKIEDQRELLDDLNDEGSPNGDM